MIIHAIGKMELFMQERIIFIIVMKPLSVGKDVKLKKKMEKVVKEIVFVLMALVEIVSVLIYLLRLDGSVIRIVCLDVLMVCVLIKRFYLSWLEEEE